MASPTTSSEAREFPARFDAVADTARFALGFCERNGISRQAAMRLRLIIEELFTNSIGHGYGGESDATVRMELATIEGYVALTYEDSAPPYNPLTRLSALGSDDVKAFDARPTENLGTLLIGRLAYGANYAYENGRNRLWLAMRP